MRCCRSSRVRIRSRSASLATWSGYSSWLLEEAAPFAERRRRRIAVWADGVGFLSAVEAVAHPPELGGSVAGPALVRRDEEIETAAGYVGNLGGAARAIVEFRSDGAESTCSGWRSRHPSCGPSAQFSRSEIAKFVANVWL